MKGLIFELSNKRAVRCLTEQPYVKKLYHYSQQYTSEDKKSEGAYIVAQDLESNKAFELSVSDLGRVMSEIEYDKWNKS